MVVPLSGFVGGGYSPANFANTQAATLVNLLVEKDESGGGRDSLRGRPGFTQWIGGSAVTLPATPPRALVAGVHTTNSSLEVLFAVGGTHLYEITNDGSILDRGSILDNDGKPAQIFQNGHQLFIVSGGYGFVYQGGALNRSYITNGSGTVDTSGTAVTWVSGDKFDAGMIATNNRIVINSVNYTVSVFTDDEHITLTSSAGTQTGVSYASYLALRVSCGGFLGGYFLALVPTTGSTPTATEGKTVMFSGLRDGALWDPLDIIVKEAQPDNAAAIFVDHEELYIFGQRASEVLRHTGSENTFDRDPSGSIEFGCVSKDTIVKLDSSVYMIAGDSRGKPVAIRLQGYQPQRVSTAAMEQIFEGYVFSDAVAFPYSEGGHRLWVIDFPTNAVTWCFDATTGAWSEWRTGAGRYRPQYHAYAWQAHYLADYANGKIYYSSLNQGGDDGTNITTERIARHVNEAMKNQFCSRVIADVHSASGASLLLSYSDNDGSTWATDKSVTLVAGVRAIWKQLGRFRDRLWRFRCTSGAVQSWVNAYLDIEGGNN